MGKPGELRALTSWKSIAEYLGVAVRTAQRWERERGLPVQHYPGSKGRVTADTAELDRWVTANSGVRAGLRQRRLLRYVAVAGLLAVVAGGVAGWRLMARHPGVLAECHFEGPVLIATDAAGKEVWRDSLPAMREAASYAEEDGRPLTLLEELDAKPGAEVLVNYDTVDRLRYPPALVCYSTAGEEKWRYLPGRVVTDGYRRFSPAQVINRAVVARAGRTGEKLILVNSHHEESWPDRFVVLDAAGQRVGEYWHAGRISHVAVGDVDGDGMPEALLAGVSEGYGAATVVMLDLREVRGTSWQGDWDPYHLHGIEHAREKRTVVFPRTCLGEGRPAVTGLRLAGNRIQVRIRERVDVEGAEVSCTLDGELRVIGCEWSERLRSLHREMELSGKLNHRLTEVEIAGRRVVRRPGPGAGGGT